LAAAHQATRITGLALLGLALRQSYQQRMQTAAIKLRSVARVVLSQQTQWDLKDVHKRLLFMLDIYKRLLLMLRIYARRHYTIPIVAVPN
jgi:hypothetical protein